MRHTGNHHERRRNSDAGKNRVHARVRQQPGQGARLLHERPWLRAAGDYPTPDGPRFLTVAVNGQDFELVLWPGTPGRAHPVYGRIPGAYTIETRNIRKAYEDLKSRGVKFDTEVEEHPWGYIAVFQDPDGNRLQVREGR
jgi:uncharacterized glyoxalase superfamily protein PhnB